MFKLFPKKKTTPGANRQTGKVSIFLSERAGRWHVRCADFLNRQERRMTVPQKKRALLLFLMIMSTVSAFWIYTGVFSATNKMPAYLRQHMIQLPKTWPDSLKRRFIEEYKRQQALRDSLVDSVNQ
jgi:hypothetical protein